MMKYKIILFFMIMNTFTLFSNFIEDIQIRISSEFSEVIIGDKVCIDIIFFNNTHNEYYISFLNDVKKRYLKISTEDDIDISGKSNLIFAQYLFLTENSFFKLAPLGKKSIKYNFSLIYDEKVIKNIKYKGYFLQSEPLEIYYYLGESRIINFSVNYLLEQQDINDLYEYFINKNVLLGTKKSNSISVEIK